MLPADLLRSKFDGALSYDAYVATGKPEHRESWAAFHARVRLTDSQRALITGFTRQIRVLAVSGTWCGDCVQQLPMLDHIARANPARVDVRFLDRDQHADLSDRVLINGGRRVPLVFFLSEDGEFISLAGDRTLSRYRALAARKLGPSCPLPGAPLPSDEIAATLADWVEEFERVQLLLRLSPRLRERHGD